MSTRAGTTGPPVADQLVARASALVRQGRVGDAIVQLRDAAERNRRTRRGVDESRCRTSLATCLRMVGDTAAAEEQVMRARRLARNDEWARLSAEAEYVEVLVARDRLDEAMETLVDAITWADAAAQTAVGTALLRRRAGLRAARSDCRGAADDLAEVARRLATVDPPGGRRALVEAATALYTGADGGYPAAVATARAAVDEADDRALAGELDLLEGAVAVGQGRLDDATALSRSARDNALAAVAPTTYIGASVALAELADLQGDRVSAYEALAVGCATVGDLLGRAGADAVFEPRFAAQREAWGADGFAAARTAYEQARRTALGR